MSPRDIDALAIWDAKARSAIGRIDAVLEDAGPPMTDAAPPSQVPQALVHRVIDRTTPPPGEIITPDMAHHVVDWTPASGGEPGTPGPTNMAHQPDRIDHWDA
jgi:hypothetical protein